MVFYKKQFADKIIINVQGVGYLVAVNDLLDLPAIGEKNKSLYLYLC